MKVEIPNSILVTLSGQTSRGVKGIEVREADGHLIFTLTDGKELDMGSVMGPKGPKGDTGAKGEKGDRGEKGDTGATGAKGETGATGATGPQGITPTIGENENWYLGSADTGKPSRGRQGEKGNQGDKGEKGDKGETGETGATGPEGPRGPQGLQGVQGEPGKGLTISGYYATAQALAAAVTNPEAGDAYGVGTAEPYDIYIYDGVTHAWVNNGPLQGAKGEKGDKGDKGDTGAVGPQGPQGETGPKGADGTNGTNGITPTIGANGNWFLGSTDTGKPSRGVKGEQGAKGDSGVYVGAGDMPEDCNVQIDPEGSVIDVYSKSEIDALIGTITDETTSVENLWENNMTWQLRNYQRWGKLCFFSLQIIVAESISTNYGFSLIKLPYASTMRIWINNGTQFYLDSGNQYIKVNSSTLNAGNYILSGMYLTNSAE